MKTTGRRLLLGACVVALVGASVYAFLPRPAAVETAPVSVGPLAAGIEEEGRTRARDRYTVAAPTAGHLERVTLRAGDPVRRGQPLAVLRLTALDPREREA
ncbi:MAG TPA: biotin/lipoyl-binding protein, partial [bacterium]